MEFVALAPDCVQGTDAPDTIIRFVNPCQGCFLVWQCHISADVVARTERVQESLEVVWCNSLFGVDALDTMFGKPIIMDQG